MEIFLSLFGACSQGVIWAVMALGLYVTYKILDYADLTVDGSLALGGSVTAFIIAGGLNPFLASLISVAAGMLAGAVTGILNTKLKIPSILSGILTMIALYSINIRVMGKANVSILGKSTVFSAFESWFEGLGLEILSDIGPLNASIFLLGVLTCAFTVGLLYWFFGTEIGSAIRATGNNAKMASALGIDVNLMKVLGLILSNGLVALSGSLIAQSQGYADVGMGTGTIVIGLASVIIGEALIKSKGPSAFAATLSSVVLGSVTYRIIIALVLYIGMNSSDLKLFTAIIVAAALYASNLKKVGFANARA